MMLFVPLTLSRENTRQLRLLFLQRWGAIPYLIWKELCVQLGQKAVIQTFIDWPNHQKSCNIIFVDCCVLFCFCQALPVYVRLYEKTGISLLVCDGTQADGAIVGRRVSQPQAVDPAPSRAERADWKAKSEIAEVLRIHPVSASDAVHQFKEGACKCCPSSITISRGKLL